MRKFTPDQYQFIERVSRYSDTNRRTNSLAVCMANAPREFGGKWDNSHVAFIGLQLRALGYVTTYKDASQYAEWNITPKGKAALSEHKATVQCEAQEKDTMPVKKEAPVTVPKAKKFRVLDTVEGDISIQHDSEELARAMASDWAKKHPGREIQVVQVVGRVKAELTINEV